MFTSELLIFLIKILWRFGLLEVEFLRKSEIYVCKFRWEFFFRVRINLMSTKRKKASSNLYLRKEPCFKTINVHVQQQNCFYKKWHNRIEIVINGNSKNEFCFWLSVFEKKTKKLWGFGLAFFWVGGKNCKLLPKIKNVSYFPNYDMLIRNLNFRQFEISFLFSYLSRNIST